MSSKKKVYLTYAVTVSNRRPIQPKAKCLEFECADFEYEKIKKPQKWNSRSTDRKFIDQSLRNQQGENKKGVSKLEKNSVNL